MHDQPSDPSSPDSPATQPASGAPPADNDAFVPAQTGYLADIDQWCLRHPWHPRVTPWLAYMIILSAAFGAHSLLPGSYGFVKIIQLLATVYLCWRYRKLVTELNWKFHWLVIPSAVFFTWAWVASRHLTEWLVGMDSAAKGAESLKFWSSMSPEADATQLGAMAWFGLVSHLLAMTIAVPMIEEVFNRSVLLRSFQRWGPTRLALQQFAVDLPIVGDWLIHTKWGERASRLDPVLRPEFERTQVGQLSFFAVIATSLVFALVHVPADWLGSLVVGVGWCLMLYVTRSKGLGPIIWSHALTNLFLWAYVIYMHFESGSSAAWRFMAEAPIGRGCSKVILILC